MPGLFLEVLVLRVLFRHSEVKNFYNFVGDAVYVVGVHLGVLRGRNLNILFLVLNHVINGQNHVSVLPHKVAHLLPLDVGQDVLAHLLLNQLFHLA